MRRIIFYRSSRASSRGNEAQILLAVGWKSEPPHVGCYFVNEVLTAASARGPAWTTHDASGLRASVLAIAEDLSAVDEDVDDAGRELVRLLEGCVVLHAGGIEGDEIREVTGLQGTAPVQFQILRRQRG